LCCSGELAKKLEVRPVFLDENGNDANIYRNCQSSLSKQKFSQSSTNQFSTIGEDEDSNQQVEKNDSGIDNIMRGHLHELRERKLTLSTCRFKWDNEVPFLIINKNFESSSDTIFVTSAKKTVCFRKKSKNNVYFCKNNGVQLAGFLYDVSWVSSICKYFLS
jgi:hypothetical protein